MTHKGELRCVEGLGYLANCSRGLSEFSAMRLVCVGPRYGLCGWMSLPRAITLLLEIPRRNQLNRLLGQ